MILNFRGEYAFLSNYYNAPVKFAGMKYPTVEHAFAAAKTFDKACRENICAAHTPGQAKRLGRSVVLRPMWDEVKVRVMGLLLYRKFFCNEKLGDRLLDTGDHVLVEGNDWNDKVWGATKDSFGAWEGTNLLGRLLMTVRSELSLYRECGHQMMHNYQWLEILVGGHVTGQSCLYCKQYVKDKKCATYNFSMVDDDALVQYPCASFAPCYVFNKVPT